MMNSRKLLDFLKWLDDENKLIALCYTETDTVDVKGERVDVERIRKLTAEYNASLDPALKTAKQARAMADDPANAGQRDALLKLAEIEEGLAKGKAAAIDGGAS